MLRKHVGNTKTIIALLRSKLSFHVFGLIPSVNRRKPCSSIAVREYWSPTTAEVTTAFNANSQIIDHSIDIGG